MSFEGPLFLVGMPRSGTKLLRDLLNRHPRIAIPPAETEFLPYLLKFIDRNGDLSDFSRFERFCADISTASYFQYRLNYRPPLTAEAWYGACRSFDAAGIFEALVRGDVRAPVGSGIVWGDKSPSYIDDIELIHGLYENAKFVHIIRDVRDYCLSIHAAWSKNILRACQRWVDDVERAREVGRKLGTSIYIELRYEDLLSDPSRELNRLCEFVEVQFDPGMTNLQRPTENLGDAKGETRIVAGNFGKYFEQMSPRVLTEVEAIAGETLVACGYERALPIQPRRRLSPWRMHLAHLEDGWQLFQDKRNRRGIVDSIRENLRYFLITRASRYKSIVWARWVTAGVALGVALVAAGIAMFAPEAEDVVLQEELEERKAAFSRVRALTAQPVAPAQIDAALDNMRLANHERARIRALLTPTGHHSSAASAVTHVATPSGTDVTAPTADPHLRLVAVAVRDTHAADGDVIAIESAGYRREIKLSKTAQTVSFPVDSSGTVQIRGVKDGGGGGITLAISGLLEEILMPIMAEGQTVSVRVAG